MSVLLRQSTAQTVKVGPFLDATDGVTEETGLASNGTELSKDGAAFAAGPTLGTHDAEGWYPLALTTTHTNTLGELIVKSHAVATHLSVWHSYLVVPAVVYDNLVLGTDDLNVQVAGMDANVLTATAINADAITAAKVAAGTIDAATFAAGAIDATAIATGAIDADSIASNAITAVKIATDAITAAKVAAGTINAATFAAGAIDAAAIGTGAIDADAIAADAIGASELATDAVNEIRDAILADSTPFNGADVGTILTQTANVFRAAVTGTADSGSTTTLVDAVRTESDTDYWKGSFLYITSGTIAGQLRKISDFNAGTDTITVDRPFTQAVGTNTYEVWPADFPDEFADLNIETDGMVHADFKEWLGVAPLALASQRPQVEVDAYDGSVDFNATQKASINTEVVDVIRTDTVTQISAIPTANASLHVMIQWIYACARNENQVTSTIHRVRNDGDTGNIATAVLADDATTFTRDKFA